MIPLPLVYGNVAFEKYLSMRNQFWYQWDMQVWTVKH
jgi:hypothetical protein